MLSTDEDDHGSDYGSDVLTNLDSDIFQSTASQAPTKKTNKTVSVALRTQNVATKRMKTVLFHGNKGEKGSDITKVPNTPIFVSTSS